MKIFSRARKKTPTVIQMEAVECGAAALSIILGYYKRYVSLEELRVACGVSMHGSNAADLVAAAASFGLDAKGVRYSLEETKQIDQPFIVFWDFNHFVVVEAVGSKEVRLNDPATGPRRVSLEEFSDKYTGIALLFSPGPAFKPGGFAPRVWPILRKRLRRTGRPFFYLSLTQLFSVIPALSLAALSKMFIDHVVIDGLWSWSGNIVFAVFIVFIFQGILTAFEGVFLYRLNAYLSIKLSSGFLHHLLRLPISFYEQRNPGDLAWRVELNDTVINEITEKLALVLLNAMKIGLFLTVIASFSFSLACISIIEPICSSLLLLWIDRSRKDAMAKTLTSYVKMMAYSVGGLQNIETIKSLGLEQNIFSKWAFYNTKFLASKQEFSTRNITIQALTPFFRIVAASAFIFRGAYLALAGAITVGSVMGLYFVMQQLSAPFRNLTDLGVVLQEVKAQLIRLEDSLQNRQDPSFTKKSRSLLFHRVKKTLSIDAISYGYIPTHPPFIQGFSLELSRGKMVAIVGPSGCGKSTIAKIASGLLMPSKGQLLYDGKPKSAYHPAAFASSITSVDQSIFIFSGSIRDNLTFWNHNIEEKDIVQAAIDADIHEEVIVRESGYNSILQPKGIDLSGGEKQRLEIARALVTNPHFLILDEATSALDPEKEARILQNIKRRGCGCLMIAHRLSAVKNADEILVMEAGAIVQRGSHQSLKEEGLYQKLFQFEGAIR